MGEEKIMIQAIEKTKVDRLLELHKEVIGSAIKTFKAAIEAGEILSEIKSSLSHGEFTPWCEANLPFDMRTAQRYMRCYNFRDRLLKNDTVSLLGAYKMLEAPKRTILDWPTAIKKWREFERKAEIRFEKAKKAVEKGNPELLEKGDLFDEFFLNDFRILVEISELKDIENLVNAIHIGNRVVKLLSAIGLENTLGLAKLLNSYKAMGIYKDGSWLAVENNQVKKMTYRQFVKWMKNDIEKTEDEIKKAVKAAAEDKGLF